MEEAFGYVNLDWRNYVTEDPRYRRPTEVPLLQADPSEAKRRLGWKPTVAFRDLCSAISRGDGRGITRKAPHGSLRGSDSDRSNLTVVGSVVAGYNGEIAALPVVARNDAGVGYMPRLADVHTHGRVAGGYDGVTRFSFAKFSKESHQDFFGYLGSQARVHLQESGNIGQILLPLAGPSGRIENGPDMTLKGRSGSALGGLNWAGRRH